LQAPLTRARGHRAGDAARTADAGRMRGRAESLCAVSPGSWKTGDGTRTTYPPWPTSHRSSASLIRPGRPLQRRAGCSMTSCLAGASEGVGVSSGVAALARSRGSASVVLATSARACRRPRLPGLV